jgi:hypothetical protein
MLEVSLDDCLSAVHRLACCVGTGDGWQEGVLHPCHCCRMGVEVCLLLC